MKEQHDNELDKLFAEKLGNFKAEPPDSVWRTVAAGVITGAASTAVWSTVAKPVIWSLSLVSMVFILNTSIPIEKETLYSNQKTEVREHISQIPILSSNKINNDIETALFSPMSTENNFDYYTPEPAELPEPEITVISKNTTNNTAIINNINTSQIEIQSLNNPSLISSKEPDYIPFNPKAFTLSYIESNYKMNAPDDYIRTPWLYLSYDMGPDAFAFNNNRIDFDSWGTNYGLGISMHVSEFYFKTGLNFLNITQKNTYQYSQNEYQQVGEYWLVDSISFNTLYDSLGNPYESPVYYTSNHPYFDSVQVSYNTHSLDHYRFFEIPMMLGIEKDIKRFTLYAQTGFTYTFSLNSSELSRDHFEDVTGTSTESWTPLSEQRLNNFWSFSIAMGAYFNTNRNISFGIEPTYRYYIDPFFSGSGTDLRTPVSYGFRVRLLYKL